MGHPHRALTEPHNRFRRSCYQAVTLFLAELPADNLLRPIQPSERIYGGKTPSRELLRTNIYKAAVDQGFDVTTSTVNGVLYVAKLNHAKAMGELAEQFKERERATPGYAPLTIVSTFDML